MASETPGELARLALCKRLEEIQAGRMEEREMGRSAFARRVDEIIGRMERRHGKGKGKCLVTGNAALMAYRDKLRGAMHK